MLPRPCFARGSLGGASVVLVCFNGQVRASRRGEEDILMDQPLTRTEPGLDDTLSSVLLLPVSFAFSNTWGM